MRGSDHDVRVRDVAENRDSNHAACRVSPAALDGHHALDHRAVLGAVKALRFAAPARRPFGALTAPPAGGDEGSCVMAVSSLHALWRPTKNRS